MFGIQYITDSGEEYYCTGQYGLQFSCDINNVQEYVSQENAKKIANNLNKSYDLMSHFGKGKLYVIEVIKIPMQREHIQIKTIKPGYRIVWDNNGSDVFYNGPKKTKYSFGFRIFGELHRSTVFKSEKEAQNTINAIQKNYEEYYKKNHFSADPIKHEKMYKPYYDQSLTYKIIYVE